MERFNRTTQEAFLKTQEFHGTVVEKDVKWLKKLPAILFAYRCRKQASTGFSPFRLMYCREPVLPMEFRDDLHPLKMPVDDLPIDQWVETMDNVHEKSLVVAGANIRKAQVRQARNYNKKHAKNEFHEGERVWRKNPLCSTKLKAVKRGANWLGPYSVVRRNHAGNYILADKCGKVHKKAYPPDHLKRCIDRDPNIIPGAEDKDYESPEDEEVPMDTDSQDIPSSIDTSPPHWAVCKPCRILGSYI